MERVLIVYASRTGTTGGVAEEIARYLAVPASCTIAAPGKEKPPALRLFGNTA